MIYHHVIQVYIKLYNDQELAFLGSSLPGFVPRFISTRASPPAPAPPTTSHKSCTMARAPGHWDHQIGGQNNWDGSHVDYNKIYIYKYFSLHTGLVSLLSGCNCHVMCSQSPALFFIKLPHHPRVPSHAWKVPRDCLGLRMFQMTLSGSLQNFSRSSLNFSLNLYSKYLGISKYPPDLSWSKLPIY